MIFLFHGQDTVASREALLKLKSQYNPTAVVSLPKDTDLGRFREICETLTLTGETRLVVIETYLKELGRRKDNLLSEADFSAYLLRQPEGSDTALWFDDRLPSQHPLLLNLAQDKKTKVVCATLVPPNVFSFLDDLAERRRLGALKKFCYWQKMGVNNHYLLTMMAWQVRRLLSFSYNVPIKISPFAHARLIRQIKKFTEAELLTFYEKLSGLDQQSKSNDVDLSLGLLRLLERITL